MKFEVIKISGVATGVGVNQTPASMSTFASFTETICETLFQTGDDELDAAESEKWATIIAAALNKFYNK